MGGTLGRVWLACAVALAAAGILLAAAVLCAPPALAYSDWIHDSIPPETDPDSCAVCHEGGTSNASCTALCHRGFKVTPGATVDGRFPESCWSCHAPGEDTSQFSSPSAACSQECHLFNEFSRTYSIPSSHGVELHLGAEPPYGVCLDCHTTDGKTMDGPTFKGLYGSKVTVTTKGKERTIRADEEYLRRSIVDPKADIVKGYSDIMPLTPVKPEELEAIVVYIRTLR